MEARELVKLLIESLSLSTETLKAFETAYAPGGEAGVTLRALIVSNERLMQMIKGEL